jgi:hypothetical protein
MFRAGQDYAANPKLGASVSDVTKNIHPEDKNAMINFIDSVRVNPKLNSKVRKLNEDDFKIVERLADKFSISMDKGLTKVANEFEDILSGYKKVKGTMPTGRNFK